MLIGSIPNVHRAISARSAPQVELEEKKDDPSDKNPEKEIFLNKPCVNNNQKNNEIQKRKVPEEVSHFAKYYEYYIEKSKKRNDIDCCCFSDLWDIITGQPDRKEKLAQKTREVLDDLMKDIRDSFMRELNARTYGNLVQLQMKQDPYSKDDPYEHFRVFFFRSQIKCYLPQDYDMSAQEFRQRVSDELGFALDEWLKDKDKDRLG